jgi:HEAT repeat protein
MLSIVVFMGGLGWLVLDQGENASGNESGQDPSTQEPVEANDQPNQVELLKIANDPKSDQRLDAIIGLLEVKQDLPTLVPALAKLLLDRDQLAANAAAIVLKQIGDEGAKHLQTMMESEEKQDVIFACSALKEMGGAQRYVPLLKKWLLTSDSQIRKQALFALQGSNEAALELLEPVMGTLDDPDFNVQCMACRVLTNLGPDAIDAVDKLVELYKTGLPSARSWAAVALGAIGPNTKLDTAEFLAGTLDAFMQPEKQRSLMGLAKMGPEASSVAEQVREVMRDKQKRVMSDAAFTLWKITGETEEPLQVMAEQLQNVSTADDTLELIAKMEKAAAPLVSDILKVIENAEEASIELAVVALGNIGAPAKSALPTLEKIASDEKNDAVMRFYAREAIGKISKAN